jgi:hypothetical protein
VLRAVLLFLAAGLLVASSASAAPPAYVFGRTGGSIAPITVTIAPNGKVSVAGPAKVGRTRLTAAQLATIRAAVAEARFSTLPAHTFCTGTLPDFASGFVTAGGRTVAVRGTCSRRFGHVWGLLVTLTRLG